MIKKAFPPLALDLFSVMLGAGLIIPLLPLYAQHIGTNRTWIGIIAAGFFIANVISTPLFGWLSDRKGRKVIHRRWLSLLRYHLSEFHPGNHSLPVNPNPVLTGYRRRYDCTSYSGICWRYVPSRCRKKVDGLFGTILFIYFNR